MRKSLYLSSLACALAASASAATLPETALRAEQAAAELCAARFGSDQAGLDRCKGEQRKGFVALRSLRQAVTDDNGHQAIIDACAGEWGTTHGVDLYLMADCAAGALESKAALDAMSGAIDHCSDNFPAPNYTAQLSCLDTFLDTGVLAVGLDP